jgi:predicted RNA-binding Zn-ribbon protein involved in translation (DUF1610 family)
MRKLRKALLLSHIPHRDDIVDKLIVNELDKRGVCSWKAPVLRNCRQMICTIQPDVLILPEIRIEYTRDIAKQVQEWGVRVVQRRSEMGISAETEITEELERCLFGNIDWAEHIDLDMVWGSGFADMLVKHGVSKEKIKVIGGVGFDPYFLPQPEIVKEEKKPAILFAGGFGYAHYNSIYAVPESKVGEQINIDLVQNDRKNRIIFSNMMKEVMDYFGDKFYYGVRGHPGEPYEYYYDLFGDKVICMQNCVTPISLGWADILIHPGSTMAYEIHLLNKPAFNFRNTNLDAVVGSLSPTFETVDELIEAVEQVEIGTSNADSGTLKQLENYYGIVDGQAYKRIVDEIMKLEKYDTNIPQDWPKDTIKYPNKYVYTGLLPRICASCGNEVFVRPHMKTSKCPWCGICMVSTLKKVGKEEQNV